MHRVTAPCTAWLLQAPGCCLARPEAGYLCKRLVIDSAEGCYSTMHLPLMLLGFTQIQPTSKDPLQPPPPHTHTRTYAHTHTHTSTCPQCSPLLTSRHNDDRHPLWFGLVLILSCHTWHSMAAHMQARQWTPWST